MAAVEDFGHECPVGSPECDRAHGVAGAGDVNADRARPDISAEMGEVVIEAGVGDLLLVAINDDDRVLDIVGRVFVDFGDQPRATGLVEDHVPISPGRSARLEV